jgi:ubiquinone/menaquinone biosynthesis C-methylase UbiE
MTGYLDFTFDYDDPRTISIFDEVSFWSSHFGALMLQHIDLHSDIDALDLACGLGFPLFELAHMHGRSCRFTGVDIWRPALERAAWKRRIYELPNVQLVRGDGAQLPFAAATFDLIVSNLGVNNFADAQAVLVECGRVARRGGRIVLTTNAQGHMREFYDVYRELLIEMDRPEVLDRLHANEAHRLNHEVIDGLLQRAGFRVERVIEDRFDMRYRDGSALLNHALTRFGFLDGWRRVVDPAVERSVFEKLEARLNTLAQREGELRMSVPMLYLEAQRSDRTR